MKKNQTQYLYIQLADTLRDQIKSGSIPSGQFLPSENELSRQFGISRISVRKALELLVLEGLVVRKMGQGTLVSTEAAGHVTDQSRTLRVASVSPSHFSNFCFPWLAKEFEKEMPGVKVALLNFPISQFWDSVQHSRLMGMVPDILVISDWQFTEAEDYEEFQDLSQSVKITGNFFYPKLLNAFRHNQVLRGIPVTFSSVFMVYNPDLFERQNIQVPDSSWTLQDLIAAAKELTMDTNGDGIIDQYGFAISSTHIRWPVIALQNGVDFSQLEHSPEQLRASLELMQQLLHKDRCAILHSFNMSQMGQDPFLNEKVAMMFTTALELAYMKNWGIPFEPKAVPVQFGPNKSSLLVANGLMVPSDCAEPELARAFIEFIIRPDIQEQLLKRFNFLSVLKPINDQLLDRTFLEAANMVDHQLSDSQFGRNIFPDLDKQMELSRQLAMFWNGLDSVSEAIERLDTRKKSPH